MSENSLPWPFDLARRYTVDKPLQATTGVLVGLAALQLILVSRGRRDAISALLQTTSLSNIGGQLLLIVWWVFVAAAAMLPGLMLLRRGDSTSGFSPLVPPVVYFLGVTVLGFVLTGIVGNDAADGIELGPYGILVGSGLGFVVLAPRLIRTAISAGWLAPRMAVVLGTSVLTLLVPLTIGLCLAIADESETNVSLSSGFVLAMIGYFGLIAIFFVSIFSALYRGIADPRQESESLIVKLLANLRVIVQVAGSILLAGVGALFCALVVVFVAGTAAVLFDTLATPWHERERLELEDGSVEDGYVLEESGRWMTFMRDSDRSIVQIEIDGVTARLDSTNERP